MALEPAVHRGIDEAGSRPILVAGGGIGGLAAAIALAGIGRRVRVLEQRFEANEEGAGIQIGPNGVHALRQLGVDGRLEPHAGRPSAIVVMDGATGRSLTRLPLTPYMQTTHGAPYWVVGRADLHQALLSTARSLAGIEIVHGFRVDVIEGTGQGTTAGVRVRDQNGRLMEGAALVGADGLWSAVANTWFRAHPPRFTGRTAARALLPVEGLAPLFGEPVTGLWLGPRAHLVHYPISGGPWDAGKVPMLNIVAIVEGGQSETEWGTPIEAAALLPAFDGWSKEVRDLVTRPGQWRRWSLMERAELSNWSDGPVTLVGDAAHPVPPFLAQGAVLALEDAVTLAGAVAAMPGDLAVAFRAYAAARRSRARLVAMASRRNGRIYHLTGMAATARNSALSWLPAERLIGGYAWLYGYRCPDFVKARA